MRICLLTGGYPYRRDALGGWCRALVEGLSSTTFDLLTVSDRELPGSPAYPLPGNVATSRPVTLARDDRHRGDRFDPATAAAWLLCRGLLGGPDQTGEMFTAGLTRLAELARPGESPLAGVPLADVLVDAWRAGADQPPLGLRDARTGATLLRHATRALGVEAPESDLVHCVGGTTPLLAALAAQWRTGVPLLLTEAQPPVPRRRPAEESQPAAVRTILRLFRRAVTRTGYAEAGLIAPLSEHHRRRALEHGASPGRLVPVPAGADPADFPAAEPAGDVVVHVPEPGDPPTRLAETMMSGRAVVAVDVGPVAETLGDAGVLVPENDPVALATACRQLMHGPQRRRELGEAARRRALACFTTDRVLRAYDALYADLAGPAVATAFELQLAGPAPRVALPTTLRWLTRSTP